jgi:hypothetical protein
MDENQNGHKGAPQQIELHHQPVPLNIQMHDVTNQADGTRFLALLFLTPDHDATYFIPKDYVHRFAADICTRAADIVGMPLHEFMRELTSLVVAPNIEVPRLIVPGSE